MRPFVPGRRYFTLIGSREAAIEDCKFLATLAYLLLLKGFVGRSGGATGADESLMQAYLRAIQKDANVKGNIEVFLPTFNKHYYEQYEPDLFHVQTQPEYEQSLDMLHRTGVCTYQDKLPHYTKLLFARNAFQIFGSGQASDFVIYAAPENEKGVVKGGTRIAVYLARYYKVPCFNVTIPEQKKKIIELIQSL